MPAKPPQKLEEDVAPLEDGHFDEYNAYPAEQVEDYIRGKYFSDGYKLFYVQHLETKVVEGNPIAEMLLYVFIKE